MTTPNSSPSPDGTPVMDAAAIRGALRRIAHEIIEKNADLRGVVLAGIPSRGVEIARRLAALIEEFANVGIATGVVDVAMYRDDVGKRAGIGKICSASASCRRRRSRSCSIPRMLLRKSARAT